ncbi:hypothetical protein [Nonomuraea dietziae]|uniref:hypothetical protein n=1 Tax=Nonomuraea dietziae TaxID=65515 RepID=UPI0031D1B30D
MALWTQLTLRTTDGSMPSFAVLESLTRRKLGWSARERELLWRTTLAAPNSGHLYQLPVSAIKDLPAAELGPLLPHIRRAKRRAGPGALCRPLAATRTLDLLLSEHPTGEPGEASRCLVPECDGFAALVRGEYGERLESPEVLPMLRHWVTATSSDPAPKWTAKARGLLTPGAVALAGEILGRLPAYRESPWNTGYRDEVTYLQQRTAELARGMVWTCELTDEPWVTGLLGDVAVATGTGMGGFRSELTQRAGGQRRPRSPVPARRAGSGAPACQGPGQGAQEEHSGQGRQDAGRGGRTDGTVS